MRFGLLAASRIAVPAIIEPAEAAGVTVAAVAARSRERAEEYAETHAIESAHGSYAELLDDDSLDAVYIGTPNSLHASWTIAALEAGRHVLCEKPLAGNADDARRVVEVADRTGMVLMEAFHWRFHGFAGRMIGAVSRLERPISLETEFTVPGVPHDNIRYQYDLGGGSLMDLGCYNLHWVRTILGEPAAIDAEMDVTIDEVDDTVRATLSYEDGSEARVKASFVGPDLVWNLSARGRNGTVMAMNPLAPQRGNRLTWDINGEEGDIEVGGPSSYQAQLGSFVETVATGAQPLVTHEDSIRNMELIDRLYTAAGLSLRP